MNICATGTRVGGFASVGDRWTFSGALTFADAAAVFAAASALPLPAAGVIDLAGMDPADSSALAVMLALKRRAAAEGAHLTFAAIPSGILTLANVYGVEELLSS